MIVSVPEAREFPPERLKRPEDSSNFSPDRASGVASRRLKEWQKAKSRWSS
jgi:hypothetical protein